MANTWNITEQRQTQELTPGGSFRDVMEIHFDVPGISSGVVRIPLSAYNADVVREAIDKQAATMIEVHGL